MTCPSPLQNNTSHHILFIGDAERAAITAWSLPLTARITEPCISHSIYDTFLLIYNCGKLQTCCFLFWFKKLWFFSNNYHYFIICKYIYIFSFFETPALHFILLGEIKIEAECVVNAPSLILSSSARIVWRRLGKTHTHTHTHTVSTHQHYLLCLLMGTSHTNAEAQMKNLQPLAQNGSPDINRWSCNFSHLWGFLPQPLMCYLKCMCAICLRVYNWVYTHKNRRGKTGGSEWFCKLKGFFIFQRYTDTPRNRFTGLESSVRMWYIQKFCRDESRQINAFVIPSYVCGCVCVRVCVCVRACLCVGGEERTRGS